MKWNEGRKEGAGTQYHLVDIHLKSYICVTGKLAIISEKRCQVVHKVM